MCGAAIAVSNRRALVPTSCTALQTGLDAIGEACAKCGKKSDRNLANSSQNVGRTRVHRYQHRYLHSDVEIGPARVVLAGSTSRDLLSDKQKQKLPRATSWPRSSAVPDPLSRCCLPHPRRSQPARPTLPFLLKLAPAPSTIAAGNPVRSNIVQKPLEDSESRVVIHVTTQGSY